MKIANFSFYPFGMSKVISRNPPQFSCQQGPEECLGNKIEACVISKNKFDVWFPFVTCMESYSTSMADYVDTCAKKVELDGEAIMKCAESTEGDNILLQMADSTPSETSYVPWVVINDKPVGTDIYEIVQKVCDEYEGTTKPESCNTFKCSSPDSMNKIIEKHSLEVYIESLCPDCVAYIDILDEIYTGDKEILKYLNISLIPFGNGKILSEDPIKITCQHGERECKGNEILGCSIHHNDNDFYKYFPFISCMEDYYYDITNETNVVRCGKETEVNYTKILNCINSEEGKVIHLHNGKITPEHRTVPHVVFDGKHISEYDSIYDHICPLIPEPKPKSCDGIDKKRNNKRNRRNRRGRRRF